MREARREGGREIKENDLIKPLLLSVAPLQIQSL